jgi:hypothetical protein
MTEDVVKGDFRLTWSKDDARKIALAEKTFNKYVQKGWLAIGELLGKKKQIFTFHPDFETIVLAPLVMGG